MTSEQIETEETVDQQTLERTLEFMTRLSQMHTDTQFELGTMRGEYITSDGVIPSGQLVVYEAVKNEDVAVMTPASPERLRAHPELREGPTHEIFALAPRSLIQPYIL